MDGLRDRARELFDSLQTVLCEDLEWIEASIALTDSDVFEPATLPTVVTAGAIDPATLGPREKIRGLTFSGKGAQGRGRFTLFGAVFDDTGNSGVGIDGIITPAEYAGIGGVVTTANTYLHSAGGSLATWHNRATYKENDHLLALVRRGIIS
jgi:hypothetical protein